ncbi:hypothetical protein [Hoeflea poritis]|uniref:Uncharacterized protein n=1 Tax=Hoeflea poritis TaxID=2993659 RepID=A0ABT4VKM3_9HYPH|nr:hypothetical protein [Hoeflea poritis]MDA4845256.1 hypothetical protein [Hoeflea poritis]
MTGQTETSSKWKKAAVVESLRKQARPNRPPTAQIFLEENIDLGSSSLEGFIRHFVEHASIKSKGTSVGPEIGKLHHMARSFSVTADPEFFAEIAKSPLVKSILPTKVDDIFPKPRNPIDS